MAVSNSDILKDGASVSATELLPEGIMVAVTNTRVVKSMVVAVTLKEDDVNVKPIVFCRVDDGPRSETPIVEIFIYSDDGKRSISVILLEWVKFEVEFDEEMFIIEDEIDDAIDT